MPSHCILTLSPKAFRGIMVFSIQSGLKGNENASCDSCMCVSSHIYVTYMIHTQIQKCIIIFKDKEKCQLFRYILFMKSQSDRSQ